MWIPLGRPSVMARVTGGKEAPCLFGTVKFYAMGKHVLVVAEISGLPATKTDFFAFHIHTGNSCDNSGGHYNPESVPHPLHAGDLPPLISCGGRAFLVVLTGRFSLCDITGKVVIIHENADDFTTQPSGNPGKQIACGVIRQCL